MSTHKKRHIAPVLFLLALLCVSIFIIGTLYGKSVADTNAVIQHLQKNYPAKISPTTAPVKAITYNTITNKDCGVQFVTPDTLKESNPSVKNIVDLHSKTQFIQVYCDKEFAPPEKIATVSLSFKEATVSAYKGVFNDKYPDEQIAISIPHPTENKKVTIVTSLELYELVSGSLSFIK